MVSEAEVVRWKTPDSNRLAIIVSRGPDWLQVVWADDAGIQCQAVPVHEERFMRRMDYRPAKAAKALLEREKAWGGSVAAVGYLRSIVDQARGLA